MCRTSGALACIAVAVLIVTTAGAALGQDSSPDEAEVAIPTPVPFERFFLMEVVDHPQAAEPLTEAAYGELIQAKRKESMGWLRVRAEFHSPRDIVSDVLQARRFLAEGDRKAATVWMERALAKYRRLLGSSGSSTAELNQRLAWYVEARPGLNEDGSLAVDLDADLDAGPDAGVDSDPGTGTDLDPDPGPGSDVDTDPGADPDSGVNLDTCVVWFCPDPDPALHDGPFCIDPAFLATECQDHGGSPVTKPFRQVQSVCGDDPGGDCIEGTG